MQEDESELEDGVWEMEIMRLLQPRLYRHRPGRHRPPPESTTECDDRHSGLLTPPFVQSINVGEC